MTTNRLYLTWHGELRRMYTALSKPQLRSLTWLVVGIYLSGSVQLNQLNQIGNKIPGRATLVSVTRRLSRFLDGMALAVRPAYEPLIRPVLARRWRVVGASGAGRRRAFDHGWQQGWISTSTADGQCGLSAAGCSGGLDMGEMQARA